jgi:large subunit ribosomal protein L24
MAKIIKGDKVLVIAGKDRNKTGKVIRVLPQDRALLIEGVNLAKKHQRPKKQGQQGQIISLPRPIDESNAMLVCPKCGKATRVGSSTIGEGKDAVKRVRTCKKCKAEI